MNSVRLRKKPWVKDAILDYADFVRQEVTEEAKAGGAPIAPRPVAVPAT